jgi:hypothetical protein
MRFSTLATILAVTLFCSGCGAKSDPTAPTAPDEGGYVHLFDMLFSSCTGVDPVLADGSVVSPGQLAGFAFGSWVNGGYGKTVSAKISFVRSDGNTYVDETLVFGPIKGASSPYSYNYEVRFRVSNGLAEFGQNHQAVTPVVTIIGQAGQNQVFRAPFRFYVGS